MGRDAVGFFYLFELNGMIIIIIVIIAKLRDTMGWVISQAGINKVHLSIYLLKYLEGLGETQQNPKQMSWFLQYHFFNFSVLSSRAKTSPISSFIVVSRKWMLTLSHVSTFHLIMVEWVSLIDERWHAEMKLQRCVTYPVIIIDMFRNKRLVESMQGMLNSGRPTFPSLDLEKKCLNWTTTLKRGKVYVKNQIVW